MRKLLFAVMLVASAGLVACGGDGDGSGNGGTGGTGGTGAVGGSGGDGGDGGTGGSGGDDGPRCGDKNVDPGEACDDGNDFSGDGCSASCELEGDSCARPLDFNVVSTLGADRIRIHAGKMPATPSTFQASCGGDGAEVFYRYQVAKNGSLIFGAAPGGKSYVSVSSECGGAELACAVGTGNLNAGRLDVTKGQILYFVIDSAATAPELDYVLGAILIPVFEEGETCPGPNFPAQQYGACLEGLRCAEVNFEYVCTANKPPVINTAVATRTGDDLTITVQGSDPDGDATDLFVSFFDGAGAKIALEGIEGSPVDVLIAFDPNVTGLKNFTAGRTIPGFFQAVPAAEAAVDLDVGISDSGNLVSGLLRIALETAPD